MKPIKPNTLTWLNKALILIDGPAPTAEEHERAKREHERLIAEQIERERYAKQLHRQEVLPL